MSPQKITPGIPAWKIVWFLRQNALMLISVVLLGVSFYFYLAAESYRQSIKQTDAEAFESGDLVTIAKAIDGDEVAVTNADGKQAVVRILGIRSFDPVANDPVILQIGQACFNYLQVNAVGQEARLTLNDTLKVDAEGRLLGYLALNPGGDSSESDLGLVLVQQGLTLVYERYPFEREQQYLIAEQEAKTEKRGLWAIQNVVDRAVALKRDWQEEKRQEAAE